MLEYESELNPEHLVSWVMQECDREPSRVTWQASVEYSAGDDAEVSAKDPEDDAGIHLISRIGTLEISPTESSEGWSLRVQMTDNSSERLRDDMSVPDAPEAIDLATYYREFVVPDAVTGVVTILAETEEAMDLAQRFIAEIVNDRHGA
jgi:hypothetical protein